MSKCYHSCTRSDLQRLQLHSLFNAMALWIKDARLRSSSTSVESLPSTFETARLKSCFEAICLKENRRPWEGLWIDLINIEKSSAALKALVSAAADVGSSCDDDHVPRESFITATTTGEAIGMYESMESSKSAPPHARRIPAILSLEAMTFDDVNQIFSTEKSGDMHSLISKSQTFKKAYQRNVELDSEFLEKLQQLYRNEQRKSRYEKNCIPTSISLISAYSPIRVPGATRKPGSCTGPAVFDCKINEVIMVSEIRSYLDMNREEVGGILTGEQVDHLCCIIVLKILRGCAWLCLNRERDGVKNERVASLAIKSVYSLLAVLEGDYSSWYAHAIGIEQYPPLFAVVEKILTTLVEAFISNSDVESFRLFQRFIVFSEKLPSLGQAHASGFIGKPLELLAAKFNPVAIGKLSSYSQLYRQAALCIPRLGSVISTPFLLQFGSCNESIAMSDEEKLEYLSTLLNLIDSCSASTDKEARHQHVKEEEEEVGRGLKEKCGADDYLCALHHQNLKRFLEANKTSYFTSALTNILKGLVDFTETASEAILADVLEVLTENSVSREWWKTVLIDSEFVHMGIQGANNLMSIIEVISSQFLEQSSNHSLVHKKAIHKSILRLLVVCNLGQPLNMIRSEIQMIEWRQSLKNVLFLWLGVFISPPLDEGGLDDFELVSEIVHAFARISIKQNQAWGVMNQCPWIIWDWYSTLIKEYVTNPIWKPVVVVFETELVKLESVWDRMVWNYGMTMVVLGWWDSLSLTTATLSSSSTTHVKTFLMWLFEKTMFATVGNTISPTPFPDTVSESVFDTLRLLCLMIVQMDESFAGNHEARSSFLASLDSKGLQVTWIQCCSCSELSRLISCLPTEWNCRGMLVSSVQDNDSCCLGILLRLLRKCAGITENQPSTVIDSLQKCGKYVEFILNLIQKQVQDPYDSGSIFNLDSFGDVVGEVLLIVDSLHHQDSTVPTLLETALHHSFFILNNCKIGSKSGKCFWEGLVRFTSRVTRFPARILKQACHTIASTEQMSLIVEMCIERQHRLEGGETSGPFAWDRITSILVVPELEEEAFVRHSLNHALIMTLFCHILQKLDACQGNQDLRILMGQQVATWITMINIEASSFTTTTSNNALAAVGNTEVAVVAAVITSSAAATAAAPSTGGYNERKMILLLSQFALLLSEELSSLPLPENHSRLRGHLPKVAEVLLKWSEDRASQGLWATLGMGPKSSLSIEFRFFARAVGTFISTRLLVKQQQQHRTASILSTESSTDASSIIYKENEHTSKLIEELNAFGKSYEATLGGSGALGEVARFLENHEKGIHELYAFIAVSFVCVSVLAHVVFQQTNIISSLPRL